MFVSFCNYYISGNNTEKVLDNNTTKVLLAAIPSGAFVIIVALVIFGLSPGDCIEIEAPGGGKVDKMYATARFRIHVIYRSS